MARSSNLPHDSSRWDVASSPGLSAGPLRPGTSAGQAASVGAEALWKRWVLSSRK